MNLFNGESKEDIESALAELTALSTSCKTKLYV